MKKERRKEIYNKRKKKAGQVKFKLDGVGPVDNRPSTD